MCHTHSRPAQRADQIDGRQCTLVHGTLGIHGTNGTAVYMHDRNSLEGRTMTAP